MDVSRMLTQNGAVGPSEETGSAFAVAHSQHSPYAQAVQVLSMDLPSSNLPPKHVCFEYLLAETCQQRARLPLRVNIFPHDCTDSIIATIKSFFGLYDGHGVSFEDKAGNTLIARYENFENNMFVHVRVADEVASTAATPAQANSPRRPRLAPAFELAANVEHPISRPSSRAAKTRSVSPPTAPGNRSTSAGTARSRARKSRGDDCDSDSDGGNASVTSSRRGKIDIVASAEISVENIVEGSRRKRSRFDSSVAMPASVSSVSPQRKVGPSAASPFQYNQHAFYYNPVPSPQSFGTEMSFKPAPAGPNGSAQAGRHYMRNSIGHMNGILPTPDPTICSVISDEDVALQLMRLGDASNYSTHGRTSTSTLDDALSGKADASSGDETEDGSDMEGHGQGTCASYSSGSEDNGEDELDGMASTLNGQGHYPTAEGDQFHIAKKPRISNGSRSSRASTAKPRKLKIKPTVPGQLQPALGNQHAKLTNGFTSNGLASNPHFSFPKLNNPFQTQATQQLQLPQLPPPGPDEEDLSSKPRCQRCRKSKKGCDRQRPCGRCRDAGIGADGCVSEDEGNGRKGRYGRHMGVSVRKASLPGDVAGGVGPPAAFVPFISASASAPGMPAAPAAPGALGALLLDGPATAPGVPAALAVGGTYGDMAPPPAVGINGLAGKKRKRP